MSPARRSVFVTVSALALAAVNGVAIPGAADAATSCGGGRIEHIAIGPSTTPLGYLDVYYDAATGLNCAMTVAAQPVSGQPKEMYVELVRCKETSPSTFCTFDRAVEDRGTYLYYAGPVSLSAPSNCIFAYGEIAEGPVTQSADTAKATGWMASHC